MILDYQEAANKSGVYKIINTHTNRIYIGQAKRFKERWSGHINSLKNRKHENQFLQNDFNKCLEELGHDDFLTFEVLEIMEGSTKIERNKVEEKIIAEYWDNTKNCYNLRKDVHETCWSKNPKKTKEKLSKINKGRKHTQEAKEKNSRAKKAFYETKEGQELIQRISDSKRGKSYDEYYGKEKAAEIKKKIRDNKLVEMNRPEVKENLRRLLKGKTEVERYGFEKAQEIKLKKSKARKGKFGGKECPWRKVIENIKLLSPDGKVYIKIDGIKEFAKKHNLRKNHLGELLIGKRKTHKGWQLINI